jgi:streptogramin lyase
MPLSPRARRRNRGRGSGAAPRHPIPVSSVRVGRLPLYVAFGHGSARVSNYKGDSVSVIRPGSEQAETIDAPNGPLGVAAGAGAIWAVTFGGQRLVRIDPETRRVVDGIPVGAGPLAVAVGAGAVWVTNRDARWSRGSTRRQAPSPPRSGWPPRPTACASGTAASG